MILLVGASSFKDVMRIGAEGYHNLKTCIKESKYGQEACNVGDDGGFASSVQDNEEALDVLIDVAASEFYKDGEYDLEFKNPDSPPEIKRTAPEMIGYYKGWLSKYPFVSIEDPIDQDNWDADKMFVDAVGNRTQIVGDNLLVTNPTRVKRALEVGACTALLMRGQIGSISEAIGATTMSPAAGWSVTVSHRSGETEDSFITDLVVGLRTGQIKTGAPCKYNQLIRIEELHASSTASLAQTSEAQERLGDGRSDKWEEVTKFRADSAEDGNFMAWIEELCYCRLDIKPLAPTESWATGHHASISHRYLGQRRMTRLTATSSSALPKYFGMVRDEAVDNERGK